MLKVGIIGYGYWVPNIVRNFNSIEGIRSCPSATVIRQLCIGHTRLIRAFP